MTMFTHSTLVLVALAVVFALAKKLRLTTELSMLTATIAAVLIHLILPQGEDPRSPLPFVEIVRHLVEGSVTYLDICLLFLTATFFMTIYKESGGVAYIVRVIVKTFHAHRFVCLILLTAVMLVPAFNFILCNFHSLLNLLRGIRASFFDTLSLFRC